MNEEWRDVDDDAKYQVSDLGRIRSKFDAQGHPTNRYRLRKGKIVAGYRKIRVGGRAATDVPIHHLVLEAFGFVRPPGAEARHLDGNKLNNVLSNLRWGSAVENYEDRQIHGTANDGERNGRARLTAETVRQIRVSTATNGDLALLLGVSKSAVSKVRTGRTWSTIR